MMKDEPKDGQSEQEAGVQAQQSGVSPAESTEPTELGEVDRLELIGPRMWSRGMTIAGIMLVFAGFWFSKPILLILKSPEAAGQMLMMVLAPPLIYGLWVLWRWWDTPRAPRAIEFGSSRVILPLSPNTKRSVELDYADIRGILPMSRGEMRAVLVDTGDLTLGYDDVDFAAPASSHPSGVLNDVLQWRIEQLPNRDEVLEQIRQRHKLGRIAMSKPTPVTRAILGIIGAYFAIELLTGALSDPMGLVKLGANAPALIARGQYWRLISANFLHGVSGSIVFSWIHLIFNGIGLYFLGVAIEKLLGSWRLLLIYLVSAIAGAAASWLFSPAVLSVGSSTAIFGLFGAFLAIHLRYWSQLPPPFRQSRRWWLVIVVINGALPVILPLIDYAAHVGGMLAGFLVALAMLVGAPQLKPDRAPSRWVRLMAGGISALTVAGLILAGINTFQSHRADDEQVFAAMLRDALSADAAPDMVNEIAWEVVATNPEAERWQLRQTRDALREVLGGEEQRIEILDTLATVEYRLARMSSGENRTNALAHAIDLEIKVLKDAQKSPRPGSDPDFFGSQIARFLDYQVAIAGPLLRDQLLDEVPSISVNTGAGTIAVKAPQKLADAAAVYATVMSKRKLVGLLRICLPAGVSTQTITGLRGKAALKSLGASDTIDVRAVLVEKDADCAGAQVASAEFWKMSDEVRALP